MKIRDLINAVDRSEKNTSSADIDIFCQALDLDQPGWNVTFDKDNRVTAHWLVKWYCTDTWVGYQVFYMDNEPVAVSTQLARKSSENLEFVSLEAATKVRAYILECLGEKEFSPSIANLDEETDPYYTVSYSSQLLVKKGWYGDRIVNVVRECQRWDDPELKMDQLMASYADEPETVFKMDVRDFKIPMHVDVASAVILGINLTL